MKVSILTCGPADLQATAVNNSETHSVSDMSDLNDVSEVTKKSVLLRWLELSRRKIEELTVSLKANPLFVATGRAVPNRYKRKGENQSQRTKQHQAKMLKDSTAKLKAEGYGTISQFFKAKTRDSPLPQEDVIDVDAIAESQASDCIDLTTVDFDSTLSEDFNFDDLSDDLDDDGEVGERTLPLSDDSVEKSPDLEVPIVDRVGADQENGFRACGDIEDMHECRPDDEFVDPEDHPEVLLRPATHPPPPPEQILGALISIQNILSPRYVTKDGRRRYKHPTLDPVYRSRLLSILSFLRIYADGNFKDWTGSAVLAAISHGKSLWLARKVREWTRQYIRDGTLPENKYGRWTTSLLEDEDLSQMITMHLQSKGPYFSAMDIVRFMDTPEIKSRYKLKKTISERTARTWLKSEQLGYRFRKSPIGQYSDGHEREDVVVHRQEVFLPAMASIVPKMRMYVGHVDPRTFQYLDDVMEEVKPRPGTIDSMIRRVVVWFHDESTFYANDRRKMRWVHKDEKAVPYAKGEGISLMVADFVSADYGWLRSPDGTEQARVLFRAGKARDGYFRNGNIIEQAERAMQIVAKYYPNDDHVFVYDNATTHGKRALDAPSARKMPLNISAPARNFGVAYKDEDGQKQWIRMANATHHDGTPHELYFSDDHPQYPGRFKGMRVLINERREKGLNLPDPSKLLAQCSKIQCEPGATDCCARRVLYTQPDFQGVRSMLDEVCSAQGVQLIYLPKYHCELNFIEQCWGYAKRVYREFPVSALDADLERNVVAALESVPIHSMRRYSFYQFIHFIEIQLQLQICYPVT